MNDISFNSTQVIEGSEYASINNDILIITGATVGSLAVEDSDGNLIFAPQTKLSNKVLVDLTGFQIGSSVWHVRFPRGESGTNTSGGINESQAVLYSLLFN